MSKRVHSVLVLSVLVLSGCDYSLRLPFPKLEKVEQFSSRRQNHPIPNVQPSRPAVGETVTVTCSSLDPGYNYSLYLTYGETGGGDPDKPDPRKLAPYFKVGNLAPMDQVATLSFDVRLVMGNDQNGDPFRLSRGQLVTIVIKGQSIEKPDISFMQSGGSGSFLIQ